MPDTFVQSVRFLALACAAALACNAASGNLRDSDTTTIPPPRASTHDWTRFGCDAQRSNASADSTGITAANAATLVRQQVQIGGTVDASPIYLHGVAIGGASHDAFFVTTTYGKTLAIDAHNGATLWTYTPASYDALAGSSEFTTATPVADPDRTAIYAASPDGFIRKLSVADGHVLWARAITQMPSREKIPSALNVNDGHVIATTGGYIGDAPPYQGHVAVLDAATGNIVNVWNSLCSDRAGVIDPRTCSEKGSAIWGRAGAVVETVTGHIFVATGDGRWDGATYWGDAVLELSADASTLLGNYTPGNTLELQQRDADLGSTSPVLLGGGYVAQGGKDSRFRVLQWSLMSGTSPHQGGETQVVSTPSGGLFTAPAVWRDGTDTWVFAADYGATAAWKFSGGTLTQVWHNDNAGSSPVVAAGLLFVYGGGDALRIYDARTGRLTATLQAGGGHWNSPIVVDGMVALPQGSANARRTDGVLNIYRLP